MARRPGRIREETGPHVEGLPPYLVRFNPAAVNIRLTVSPRRGLVVTVPLGVSAVSASEAVERKRAWIERHLARLAEHPERPGPSATGLPASELPSGIEFPAVDEAWRVAYRPTGSATARVLRAEGRVVLSGAVHDPVACVAALNRFVDARAREVLPAELHRLALSVGLSPARVAIRHQRTRWGSCSSAGTVSLNRNLLFLPRDLAVSVMLHELVHLVQHNHSPRFWEDLETLDPLARQHRREMRDAWRHVPRWAER